LLDISNYNSRYQEVSQSKHCLEFEQIFTFQDMTDVFERCQRKEAQRLQTFKDTLFTIHKCLNIVEDPA
jgi:DNA integrity scanning protein DisA with diadenylate cyclase activity